MHRLKKKLRMREASDGDWMTILAQKQSAHQQEMLQWKALMQKKNVRLHNLAPLGMEAT